MPDPGDKALNPPPAGTSWQGRVAPPPPPPPPVSAPPISPPPVSPPPVSPQSAEATGLSPRPMPPKPAAPTSAATPPTTRQQAARNHASTQQPIQRHPIQQQSIQQQRRARRPGLVQRIFVKHPGLEERQQAKRKLPSWLVSFVVHLAGLLLLALIPIRQIANGPLTLFFGSQAAPGIAEFELMGQSPLEPNALEANELMELSTTTSVELLTADLDSLLPKNPTALNTVERATKPLSNLPYGLANGLVGRTGLTKQSLLDRYGGNAETEDAVELGLAWLARQQKSDGSWSLVGDYSDGAENENRTAATALALNAFLGAGYTNRPDEKYSDVIRLGLAYLLSRQNSDGFFSTREPSRQQMYAQALASIAVIEAYGLTGDSKLRSAAERAVRFAQWSQSDLNGWRYEPQQDADLSVTGWFVMVLETAKMTGLTVDEQVLQNVHQFLDSVSADERSRYAYNNFEPPSLSMTAEGMLCRIMLGWSRTEPPLVKAISNDLLVATPASRSDEPFSTSIYYYYYATQVLHHVGGDAWNEWNSSMKTVFPRSQVKTGPEAGSWEPGTDIYAASGGRLYTTALHIYCLEVYYRHLSIYDLGK